MLDVRAQQGSNYEAEEKERERKQEEEISRLMHETRLWRMANTAHWVAWGIVQAKVPELDEEESAKGKVGNAKGKAKEVLERVVEGVKSGLSGRRGSRGVAHPDGTGKVLAEPVDEENAAAAAGEADGVQESAVQDDEEASAKQNGTTTNDATKEATTAASTDKSDTEAASAEPEHDSNPEEEAEEFDYLAYAQDRAMFFWGDALQMGLIEEKELPEEVRERVKRVAY